MKHWIVVITTILCTTSLWSQEGLFIEADTLQIRIGEPIQIRYGITYDGSGAVQLPPLAGNFWGDSVEVLFQTPADTQPVASREWVKTFQRTVQITSFDSGMYRLRGIPVMVDDDTLFTGGLVFSAGTVPVDTTAEIRDIRSVWAVSYGILDVLWEYKVWIAAGIMLAYLLTGAVCYWQKKRRQKAEQPEPEVLAPVVPPHEIALQAISEMRRDKPWRNERYEPFFTRLNRVFRQYLEDRFRIEALENTSGEILRDLQHRISDRNLLDELKASLNLTDMVKFARETASESSCERSLELIENLVQRTRLEEKPAEKKEKKRHETV